MTGLGMDIKPVSTCFFLLILFANYDYARSSCANASATPVKYHLRDEAQLPCHYGKGVVNNIYWKHCNGTSWLQVLDRFKGDLAYGVGYSLEKVYFGEDGSTLIVRNATIPDEGTYKCDVDIVENSPVLNVVTAITLFGPAKISILECANTPSSCSIKIKKNVTANLSCVLSDVYPNKNASVNWFRYDSATPLETYPLTFQENLEGTYTYEKKAPITIEETTSFVCRGTFPSPEGIRAEEVSALVVLDKNEDGEKNNLALLALLVIPVAIGIGIGIVYIWRKKLPKTGQAQSSSVQDSQQPETVPLSKQEDTNAEGRVQYRLDMPSDMPERPKVPEEQLQTLAENVPRAAYEKLCHALGIKYNQAHSLLSKHSNDTIGAVRECLQLYKARTGAYREDLQRILDDVGLSDLKEYISQSNEISIN